MELGFRGLLILVSPVCVCVGGWGICCQVKRFSVYLFLLVTNLSGCTGTVMGVWFPLNSSCFFLLSPFFHFLFHVRLYLILKPLASYGFSEDVLVWERKKPLTFGDCPGTHS